MINSFDRKCILCDTIMTEECTNIFYCPNCDQSFEILDRDECIKQNYPFGCIQMMIDLGLEGDICPGYDECTRVIEGRS